MRIRSIKPEFWRSEDIADLDVFTRLLFIGLWSYVDDHGRGRDNVQLVTADLFALDPVSESFANVSRGLARLSAAGLITRYEVAGKAFLYITGWSKHQRVDHPQDSRYPSPDEAVTSENDDPALFANHSRAVREGFAPGSGIREHGTGNKGTGKETPPRAASAPPDRFPEFWAAYPRKDDKPKARAAFNRKAKDTDPDLIIDGAQRYRDDPNRDPGYTKLPATWLNAEAWNNQPIRAPAPKANGRNLDAEIANTVAIGARLQAKANGSYDYPLEISR